MRRRTWAGIVAIVLLPVGAVGTMTIMRACYGYGVEAANEGQEALGRGDFDRAIERITVAIDSGQLRGHYLATAHRQRADAHFGKRGYDLAIRDYDTALLMDPRMPGAFNDRGLAHAARGAHARAIQDFDAALRLRPTLGPPHYNRAISLAATGELDRAIEDYTAALNIEPTFAPALVNRGALHARKGDHDAAMRDWDQALRLAPDLALVFLHRGASYVQRGAYDRAIQEYEAALRVEPRQAEALNGRGEAYALKGDGDRAIKDFDAALAIAPRMVQALVGRAHWHFERGEFALAARDFGQAASLRPGDRHWAIWAYLASERAGHAGAADLARRAGAWDLTAWPGPAIAMFLGRLAPPAVLAAAAHPDPRKNAEQLCEANFYAGQHRLLAGDRAGATRLFRATVATGVARFFEHRSAQTELRRLGSAS